MAPPGKYRRKASLPIWIPPSASTRPIPAGTLSRAAASRASLSRSAASARWRAVVSIRVCSEPATWPDSSRKGDQSASNTRSSGPAGPSTMLT